MLHNISLSKKNKTVKVFSLVEYRLPLNACLYCDWTHLSPDLTRNFGKGHQLLLFMEMLLCFDFK